MRRQLDLTARPGLQIEPGAGRDQPRLWVRRLVVWEAPGGRVVRDIALRPGLNIVWSPDPADEGARIDHKDVLLTIHSATLAQVCARVALALGRWL